PDSRFPIIDSRSPDSFIYHNNVRLMRDVEAWEIEIAAHQHFAGLGGAVVHRDRAARRDLVDVEKALADEHLFIAQLAGFTEAAHLFGEPVRKLRLHLARKFQVALKIRREALHVAVEGFGGLHADEGAQRAAHFARRSAHVHQRDAVHDAQAAVGQRQFTEWREALAAVAQLALEHLQRDAQLTKRKFLDP